MGADHEASSLPPASGSSVPPHTPTPPPGASPLPARTSPLPARTSPLPARVTPQNTSPIPARITPQNTSPLPARTSAAPGGASALPVRTTRYRRTGRHSSPHQLSLPSDAPALVIAVPGPATPENEDAATAIANLASSSCRGAAIRVGFLRGDIDPLGEVLSTLHRASPKAPIVVVPLLAFPDPEFDAEIATIAAGIGPSCLRAAPLGPHPLLAAALHTRLAEVGLARSARVGRISIVTAAEGVIVGAAGHDEAEHAAGVVGVLLASRLTIPVVPASLASPASLHAAVGQLQAARVTRVALAPCVIGPEIAAGTLADITARTGIECAPPLGAHIAIGQLVAIRYGAALEDPKLGDLVGSG